MKGGGEQHMYLNLVFVSFRFPCSRFIGKLCCPVVVVGSEVWVVNCLSER